MPEMAVHTAATAPVAQPGEELHAEVARVRWAVWVYRAQRIDAGVLQLSKQLLVGGSRGSIRLCRIVGSRRGKT